MLRTFWPRLGKINLISLLLPLFDPASLHVHFQPISKPSRTSHITLRARVWGQRLNLDTEPPRRAGTFICTAPYLLIQLQNASQSAPIQATLEAVYLTILSRPFRSGDQAAICKWSTCRFVLSVRHCSFLLACHYSATSARRCRYESTG